MRTNLRLLVLATILSGPLPLAAPSHASVPYQLEPSSRREWGCHDPCACPESVARLTGGFRLVREEPDPLFENYALTVIDWKLEGHSVRITGTGRYRIGGEVALMHELILDLDIGGVPHHYESGRQVGGSDFPRIRITAAAETVGCYHDVVVLDAAPATAAVAPGPGSWLAAIPNPFVTDVELGFLLKEPGVVAATVLDPAGRRVRTLLSATRRGAGVATLRWDGNDDHGRPVRPGVYRALLEVGGRRHGKALVRVR